MALNGCLPAGQLLDDRSMSVHDEFVGAGNGCQLGGGLDFEDEGLVQTSSALKDCATSRATTEDGDSIALASLHVGFRGGFIGVAEHDEEGFGFPETEDGRGNASFRREEKGFITGQICLGLGPCLVK